MILFILTKDKKKQLPTRFWIWHNWHIST